MEFHHISVLPQETIRGLVTDPAGTYVDCTLGGAGHAGRIAARLTTAGRIIGIDQDAAAIAAAKEHLAAAACRVDIVHDNFRNLEAILAALPAVRGGTLFVALGALYGVFIGLGYPALRVQHHFLAFVTLAFNTLVFLVLRNEEWLTGGSFGLVNIPRPDFLVFSTAKQLPFYYFTLACFGLSAGFMWWIVRSPWGRAG